MLLSIKDHLLLLFVTILGLNCYSQISFEKGYYIDNSGQKVECLIKNIDWKNNPKDFEYKLSETSDIKNTNISYVREFGIYNDSKYIREQVKIDRSRESIDNLSRSSEPIFSEEKLFLKVLVEGKANLYLYVDENLRRYFYNKEDSNIEPLIYKRYNTLDYYYIKENVQFKQQLWNDLKCSIIEMKRVENLKYKKNSLISFFTDYNRCNNSDFTNYNENKKRDLFNLSIRPRLNNASLKIENTRSNFTDTDLGSKLNFGFGIEAEYILPFNKNKWSISIEPTYQSFKSEKTTNANNISGGSLTTKVAYSSIEIPLSLRHYFFLNDDSKIFANVSYVFDANLNSSVEFINTNNIVFSTLDIQTRTNLAFGVGYKIYDTYSLEVRYQTRRELLGEYVFWNSNYQTLSIIFGYSIF
ncbi:outer membrane beta-barrel protein [Flavivirga eckloniae]|uniref:tRNA modification GTPase n=1 Tax=Flavivirga eckloniae TaxID=1803846 RepID=A0A2K9PVW9_9FLAO|nr:outer membrane beta-barrel protein [Flavivirga eckloniae]AUP81206.1 tRNA modification GTPase [Flavivirga eckloniae]